MVAITGSLMFALLTAEPRRRPIALAIAFTVRIAVPSYAGNLEGISFLPAMHPSVILIFAYALVWLVRDRVVGAPPSPNPVPTLCHVAYGLVVMGALLMSSQYYVVGQMIAPYLMCILICNTATHGQVTQETAGRAFVWVCLAESAIALAVNAHAIPSVFPPPEVPPDFAAGREYGTMSHPLFLGLLLAAGFVMAAYFRSRWKEYLAMLLIVVGVFLSQARTALAGVVVGIVYLIAFAPGTVGSRVSRLVAAFCGYLFLNATGVGSKLAERVQNDLGSAEARKYAAQFFQENWADFKLVGVGIDLQKTYFQTRGLNQSAESAFIGYSIGIGIPLTLLYFAVVIWLIGCGIRSAGGLYPASAAALIVLGCIQFFSSISTDSSVALVVWTVVGIGLAPPSYEADPRRRRGVSREGLSASLPVQASCSAPA